MALEVNPPPSRGGSFEFNRPIVVALLFLLTYFTLFSGPVGLVVAYIWRREATEEWELSQLRYLIRSFWLGVLYLAASALPIILLVATVSEFDPVSYHQVADKGLWIATTAGAMLGALGFFATVLWFAVRCVLSIVNAMPHQPLPRPATWWL